MKGGNCSGEQQTQISRTTTAACYIQGKGKEGDPSQRGRKGSHL